MPTVKGRELVTFQDHQKLGLKYVAHCDEILAGGDRGGGKTLFLCGTFNQQMINAGENARFCNGIILRKSFPELQDAVKEAKKLWLPLGAKFLGGQNAPPSIKFPTGAELKFDYLKDSDVTRFQGRNLTFVGIDEAQKFGDFRIIQDLFAAIRNPYGIRGLMVYTANPGDVGRSWIVERFVSQGPPLKIIQGEKFINALGKESAKKRVFIPMSHHQNRELLDNDPDYIQNIIQATEGDPAKRAAWLYGDWTAQATGFFKDAFSEKHNVVRVVNPKIPNTYIFRAYDLGGAVSPYAVIYILYAARPTQIALKDENDNIVPRYLPQHSMVALSEIYGCDPQNYSKGLNPNEEKVCEAILEHDKRYRSIPFMKGPADRNLWTDDPNHKKGLEQIHKDYGLFWDKPRHNKSIQIGMLKMKRMLAAAHKKNNNEPILLINQGVEGENCRHLLREIRGAEPHETKDFHLNPVCDDHALDALRYGVTSREIPRITIVPRRI